ncbi:MAG: asparagine synthase (glutamine-hydrolyzing), partial [Mariniblastus sp.]
MCGILGIIGDGSNTVSQLDDQQLIAMRDTMTARGPDDAGLFREGPISLGHRRLAIRDLQGGQQPFVTRDGRFVLVFNGEIYNDDEIRKELAAAGSPLHSCSDTETLGEAWSQWGPACLEKLSGMFAFGIVDRRTRETWLVRDRCGVKPLFYSQIGREFVFASSIAAIRRHPRFSSSPNFSALGHYLQTLRTNLDHQTVFENVFTVRPAEIIHLIGTRRLHRTYWSLPDSTHTGLGSNEPSYDEAIAETTRAIEASVKLRLKSDVPLG